MSKRKKNFACPRTKPIHSSSLFVEKFYLGHAQGKKGCLHKPTGGQTDGGRKEQTSEKTKDSKDKENYLFEVKKTKKLNLNQQLSINEQILIRYLISGKFLQAYFHVSNWQTTIFAMGDQMREQFHIQ